MARRYRLICFDEFHVADITDAMILHRLLAALFDNGVGFVTTSNFKPDDLYPDGLHRDRILPAIALLNAATATWSMSTTAPTTGDARWSTCSFITRRWASRPMPT